MKGWVGFDLDGTLAFYDGFKGAGVIGDPIPLMVDRLKATLAEGKYDVKIFTARVYCPPGLTELDRRYRESLEAHEAIREWCKKHIGVVLPVTCQKDYSMVLLYDDRCAQVIPNTGVVVGE